MSRHWRSTVYSTDLNGRAVFLYVDFAIFYALPVMVSLYLAWLAIANKELADFILKFSLLSIPLTLNLFFQVVRLIQDDQKQRREERKMLNGETSPLGSWKTAAKFNLKRQAMTELAYHLLYSSCACFVCAVLAGLLSFDLFWPQDRVAVQNTYVWSAEYGFSAVLYSAALHTFFVGLQIIRKTYNIMSFTIDFENEDIDPGETKAFDKSKTTSV